MSGTEIVVILLLALVVLGPEKLPDAIRKFGKTYAELKKMGTGFQQEFKSAIDEPMREMRETADLLKKSVDFSGAPPHHRRCRATRPPHRSPTTSVTDRRATTALHRPIQTACPPTTCRSPTTTAAVDVVEANDVSTPMTGRRRRAER